MISTWITACSAIILSATFSLPDTFRTPRMGMLRNCHLEWPLPSGWRTKSIPETEGRFRSCETTISDGRGHPLTVFAWGSHHADRIGWQTSGRGHLISGERCEWGSDHREVWLLTAVRGMKDGYLAIEIKNLDRKERAALIHSFKAARLEYR